MKYFKVEENMCLYVHVCEYARELLQLSNNQILLGLWWVGDTNLVSVVKLNITGNNGLHNAKEFRIFIRKFSDMYYQLMDLLFLSSKLSLVRQVLRLTTSTIWSILTRSIYRIQMWRYRLQLGRLQFQQNKTKSWIIN